MPADTTTPSCLTQSARRSAAVAFAVLAAAGGCQPDLPSGPGISLPGLNPTATWSTDTLSLECPGAIASSLAPKTTWLVDSQVAPAAIRIRLASLPDSVACSTGAPNGASTAKPVQFIGVAASRDSGILVTAQGYSEGRSDHVVFLNGARLGDVDVLTASQSFASLAVGHRGAGWLWPEMTLASVRAAALAGLRLVEVAVRLTADSVPVVIHDSTVDRTTDGYGMVSELPASYVLSLHAAKSFGPTVANELVPSLASTVRTADSAGVGLILEIAWQDRIPPEAQARVILGVLDATPHTVPVYVSSVDTVFLNTARAQAPGQLLMLNPDHYEPWHRAFCSRVGVSAILYWPQTLGDPRVAEAVRGLALSGLRIFISTTNDLSFADALARSMPLSGILTDLPPQVFALGFAPR